MGALLTLLRCLAAPLRAHAELAHGAVAPAAELAARDGWTLRRYGTMAGTDPKTSPRPWPHHGVNDQRSCTRLVRGGAVMSYARRDG